MVFPNGIPAFEHETRFLAIRQPMNEPLVFLQSLATPSLCFAALPAQVARPGFRLRITPEDLEALDLDVRRQPIIGREVFCLTILSVEETGMPTVNLLAPVVVNLRTRCGRQVIQADARYSHREPLARREAACS